MNEIQQRVANMKPADKVIALLLLLAIASGGAFGLSLVLPFLIELAKDTIWFGTMLGVIIVGGFMIATSWRSLYYWWMNIARNIRRAVVKSDPIGTLTTVIGRFERQMEEIDGYIKQIDGAIRRLKMAIVQALQSRDNELNLATIAKQQDKGMQAAQHATAAKRWEDSATRQQPMASQLDSMLKQLKKARDFCQIRLDDTENQKIVLRQELDALIPGQNVVKKMKHFFGHNPDLEMKEMAVEEAERQATEAMAEIDNFMQVMSPMLESQDLQQSADQLAAMARFNQFLETGKVEQLPAPVPVAQIVSSTKVKEVAR